MNDNMLGITDAVDGLEVSGPVVADNTWHHVAYSRNGSLGTLYVDGVLVTNHTADFVLSSNDFWSLGQEFDPPATSSNFLDGFLDEVRIWEVSRSATEIQNTLFGSLVGNEAGLVAYYKFDQVSATSTLLPDRSTTENNGSWIGSGAGVTTPQWVPSGAFSLPPLPVTDLLTSEVTQNQINLVWTDNSLNETAYIIERSDGDNFNYSQIASVGADVTNYEDITVNPDSKYFYRLITTNAFGNSVPGNEKFAGTSLPPGNALDFDGVNDYIDAGSDPSVFGHTNLTLEGWVKPDYTTGNDQYVIISTIGAVGASGGYQLLLNSSGQVVAMYRDATGADRELDPMGTTVLTGGEWYHIAATFEESGGDTQVTIAIDGVVDNSGLLTGVIDYTAVSNLYLGTNYDGEAVTNIETREFSGELEEVRIWSTARTVTDIDQARYLTLIGNETDLVSYYRFDQGEAGIDNSSPAVTLLPDRARNNNNGTLNNFTLTGTTSNWIVSTAQTPLPPSDLFTTDVSSGQIDLTWTDNSANETGFIIERSQSNTTAFSPLTTIDADITSYSDNSVSPGVGYFYRVRAEGTVNNSVPSNEKFGSTILPPGNTLHFDGVNDLVDLGTDLLNQNMGTIELWVNPGLVSGSNDIVGYGIDQDNYFALSIQDGLIKHFLKTGGTVDWRYEANAGNELSTDQWYHLSFVHDGTAPSMYINGLLVGQTLVEGVPNDASYTDALGTGMNTFLGAGQQSTLINYFNGQIDEVRIWNVARTQSQIQMYQHMPLVGSETGLVAYYRFDQGVAGGDNNNPVVIDNLPDRSTNQNDGTLMNFDLGSPDPAVSNWVASSAPIVGSGVIQQDIDALTDFYNDLNGAGWTDNTGWLSGDPSGWFGVSTNNNRVMTISLPSNNLAGNITASFQNLTGLETLNISDNEINSLTDISGLPVLSSADVRDNLLQFESLENNFNVTGIIYGSQKVALEPLDILSEVGTDILIDRTILGDNNVYAWFKTGSADPLTETGPVLTIPGEFINEGTYFAQVTNTLDPGDANGDMLTITTASYTLKISSLERDRIALNNIYTATGGDTWTDNTGWDSDDLSTRFGVTVSNNRVTALSLPANNLQGNMPIDLKDIGQIAIIELQDNELRALPDVSSLTENQLTTLNVTNNRLGFGDLIPNLSVSTFSFDPQRRYGTTLNEQLPLGADFELSISMPGDGNAYQWFRKARRTPEEVNGSLVEGATLPTYSIEGINFDKMGIYYVEVTNPAIPGFMIRNRNQNVFAITDINGTVFLNEQTGIPMTDGDVLLYEVLTPGQPFELTGSVVLPATGAFSFPDVILGEYLLLGRPGPSLIDEVLQTYHKSNNDWVTTDRVPLEDAAGGQGINIDMLSIPVPFDPTLGDATVLGTLESDFPDPTDPEAGLRGQARRRVRRAGVSLNKLVTRRRTLQEQILELVAYTETNDNGEFSFGDIPPGEYLLNIQIPGVPMDTTNLIEFVIEESRENQVFNVEALALPDAIRLELIEETGFYRKYFKNLEVYPNPANDYVRVRYEQLNSATVEVRLIDMIGRQVHSKRIEKGEHRELEIDVAKLKPGIYLMNIVDTDSHDLTIANYRLVIE